MGVLLDIKRRFLDNEPVISGDDITSRMLEYHAGITVPSIDLFQGHILDVGSRREWSGAAPHLLLSQHWLTQENGFMVAFRNALGAHWSAGDVGLHKTSW